MHDEARGPARTGNSQRLDRVPAGTLDPTWTLMSEAHRTFPVIVSYLDGWHGPVRQSE